MLGAIVQSSMYKRNSIHLSVYYDILRKFKATEVEAKKQRKVESLLFSFYCMVCLGHLIYFEITKFRSVKQAKIEGADCSYMIHHTRSCAQSLKTLMQYLVE